MVRISASGGAADNFEYSDSIVRRPNFMVRNGIPLLLSTAILAVVLVVVGVLILTVGKNSPATYAEDATTEKAATIPATRTVLRLPTNIKPFAYIWHVKTYMPFEGSSYPPEKNFTFESQLSIQFECMESTSVITLHQNGLKFDTESISVSRIEDGNTVESNAALLDKLNFRLDDQMIDFVLTTDLQAGSNYSLNVSYGAPISKDIHGGIYRTSYVHNGQTRWFAVTQMQPIDARRALPCFDEPSNKATYDVTITHPVGSTALSNGIELTENVPVGEGWLVTKFATTPPMVTYLIALAVSDFVYEEQISDKGLRLRFWSEPDKMAQLFYAKGLALKALEFFEEYTAIPFPLKKLDVFVQVFHGGGMENWGFVVFNEPQILYDPSVSTLSQKRNIISTLCHETVHQWFGNLVTMHWWDDLWLNEGFASLLEAIIATNVTNNAFGIMDDFVREQQRTMVQDQSVTSLPLYAANLADVFDAFGSISYSKGSLILLMVQNIIGPDLFREGIRIYLDRFKYQHTDHDDLWNSYTEAVAKNGSLLDWNGKPLNVTEFAASWTLQRGFPYVNVSQMSNGSIVVQQDRFKVDIGAIDKEENQQTPFGYTWYIPLWYVTESISDEKFVWLGLNRDKTVIPSTDPQDAWILLNNKAKGYYRVVYSTELWQKLAEQLERDHKAISKQSRSQLLDDAFEAARADLLPYETPLTLTNYLRHELEWAPWWTALSKFATFRALLESTPRYGYFRKYMLKLLKSVYDSRGWDAQLQSDDSQNELLQSTIINWSCEMGHPGCIEKSVQLYQDTARNCTNASLSSECNQLKPSLRSSIYCMGIHHGTIDDWEELFEKHFTETTSIELSRQIYALGCSQKPWIIKRMLHVAITSDRVKAEKVNTYFYSASRNPVSALVMWEFMKENWPLFRDRYAEAAFFVVRPVLRTIVGFMTTEAQLAEVENFVETYPEVEGFNVMENQLEAIRSDADWLDRNYESLTRWFEMNSQ